MSRRVRRAGQMSARLARKRKKAEAGLETGPDGFDIGRDPRRLSPAELRALGHRAAPLLQAMRKRCIDCCGGRSDEVRRCTAVSCSLWPYRMATDPWRGDAPTNTRTERDVPIPPSQNSSTTASASENPYTAPATTRRRRKAAVASPDLPLFDEA
ncbi:MAG: hypothetical protein JNM75_07020 [Rhodospirillales bacterium]|nr:hypothetical protein [Rhodospirillales bacterium]